MALSEDQRALLRLLLSGDTYDQVADVLGIDAGEVRSRAHAAAAAVEDAPDREFPPDAVRGRLGSLEDPSGTHIPQAAATPAAGSRRSWALWLALGAAAVVVVVVLVVAVGGAGDDQGGDGAATTTRGDQEDVVPIKLSPVAGSKASGMISVVRVADQPAVDLAIAGLEPSGSGQSYVLWFVGSGGRSLPVAFRAVGPDGRLTGRTPIPTAAEGLLPSFTTAVLTVSRQREAAAAVQQAAQSATLPQVVGTPVMRGALR
jgi:hypothetical protein